MGRRNRRESPPQEPVEAEIHDLAHDGRGVGRVGGKALFVFGALPGERVRCHITRSTRHFDEGQVETVLQAAEERVEPACEHFSRCGGCVLQHLRPEAQIRFKHRILQENLRRLGKVEPEQWAEPLHGRPWHYRRRARLSTRALKEGGFQLGFRQRQDRQIESLRRCPVLDERVGEQLPALADCLNGLQGRRDIPQVEFSCGDEQVVLVVRHMRPLVEADLQALQTFCSARGWNLWLQPEGPDSAHAADGSQPPVFTLPDEGLRYRFQPLDFIQVNDEVNRRMVAQAMQWLAPGPDDRVLDLFCGLGNFTLPLARRAGQVVGVEGDEGLVARARTNADINGLKVDFYVADLRKDHRHAPWAGQGYSQVLIDPPRSGAAEVLPLIAHLAPARILYVSCHPGSLARDAGMLVHDHGYRLVRAGAMDMFPHTAHVESMALFEKA